MNIKLKFIGIIIFKTFGNNKNIYTRVFKIYNILVNILIKMQICNSVSSCKASFREYLARRMKQTGKSCTGDFLKGTGYRRKVVVVPCVTVFKPYFPAHAHRINTHETLKESVHCGYTSVSVANFRCNTLASNLITI
jgi:hypothetical protein